MNKKGSKTTQEQLTFEIINKKQKNKKNIQNYNIYDCIEKYKYVGIENYKEYLFEKDTSLNKCVISSITGEEVDSLKLPLLSEISAGAPIYMNEEYEEYFYIPNEVIRSNKDLFMLKVKGDSMIDADIDDGDYVVIKKDNNLNKRSIVAVEVDGHATLKKFEVQGNKLILLPQNINYEPIVVSVDEARIIGRAIGVVKCDVK
ncbi:transcriptional repressor LexA [Romboutsia lituseburensis]|uniref:transcriptional repressor LexA n=1 Tax=Romboutsia lituseburensis TaxID=1537 RepID=UPI0022EAD61F|nr:transcriptional repressor LexA [Romboutsia lituseburensis]